MRFIYLLLTLSVFITSCKQENKVTAKKTTKKEVISFQNKGHELVYKMVEKVGTYTDLARRSDVVYTYYYITPDGKTDISTEKYIFDGELSYGEYTKHERTLPKLEGIIKQGYDGNEYWLKNKDSVINDEKSLKTVAFKRPTNFYWFAMFQKLLDPGLTYEYLSEKEIDNKKYDVVKVSFNSKNDRPTDIYQIYINKKTLLVDQFLFTVADFGVIEKPLLMQVSYSKIGGLYIPTNRKYKKSDWNATIDDKPWINVIWKDIKFDNGLTVDDFKK